MTDNPAGSPTDNLASSPTDSQPHSPTGSQPAVVKAAVVKALTRAASLDQPAFITILSAEQVADIADGVGPLAGLTFAVKDNIDLAGVPTTAGNPAVTEPAPTSATAGAVVLDHGATPIGKTNLDQYATGLVGTRSPYGACSSIYSAAHVSGGSSSGSAVAVAAGVVDFALGTDTAGSGRVPAAFNGLVGFKATRGLISASGVVPACRSLDCVTVLCKTVGLASRLLATLAQFDASDAYSRARPQQVVHQRGPRPVFGVPSIDLGLDPVHQRAWEQALQHAEAIAELVAIDVTPFLQAAELLYSGPWIAERSAAFGHLLSDDNPGIDPTVKKLVQAGPQLSAEDAFRGMYRLAELRRQSEPAWRQIDALLLPTTPTHPSLTEVAAEPIAVNSRLGRFTNMTNLLDLAAIAVPAGLRSDGLPFGVQLLAPAFSDDMLLDLGAAWLGEPAPGQRPASPPEGFIDLAVAGAHLSGQPLNHQLTDRGANLVKTTAMASGYRMFEVPGPIPRPGVTRVPGHPVDSALEVELWRLPAGQLASFMAGIAPPLAIGRVELADFTQVLGFVCSADGVDVARDITRHGGWRAYLAQLESAVVPYEPTWQLADRITNEPGN